MISVGYRIQLQNDAVGKTTALIHQLPAEKEPEDLSDTDLLSLVGNAIPFSLNPPALV